MRYRDRFVAIMNYRPCERMPAVHWDIWPETRQRWISEGMPADVDEFDYLDAVPRWTFVGKSLLGLYPAFEEQTLEDTVDYRLVRAADGTIQKVWKDRTGIPQFVDHTLKTTGDWPAYKERLQPDPGRIPADLNPELAEAQAADAPIAIALASLMGWIRNWMGPQNMAYLMYDAPDVYADMVNTLADLSCWCIDQIMSRMNVKPDLALGWEDICFRSGPLVSPAMMKQHVAPGYRKVRDKLASHGIGLMGIDCDGLIEPLLGHWLDAGVNLHYPVEIGAWGADPLALRRKFGRELRMVGGFNKLVLEQGPDEIDAEIARRIPLVEEGGYIIMPDHHITPGTSLANYKYYLDRIRSLRV